MSKKTIYIPSKRQTQERAKLESELKGRSFDVDSLSVDRVVKPAYDNDDEVKKPVEQEEPSLIDEAGEVLSNAAKYIPGPIGTIAGIADNAKYLYDRKAEIGSGVVDAVGQYVQGKIGANQSEISTEIAPSMAAISKVAELKSNEDPSFNEALEYYIAKKNGTLPSYLMRFASTSGIAMDMYSGTDLSRSAMSGANVDLTGQTPALDAYRLSKASDSSNIVPTEIEASVRQHMPLIEAYERAKKVSDGLAVASHDLFDKKKTALSEFDILKTPDKAMPQEYITTEAYGTSTTVKNPNYKKELEEWNRIQSENLPSLDEMNQSSYVDYTADSRVLSRKKTLEDRFNSNTSSIKYNQEYSKALYDEFPLSEKFKRKKESGDLMYNLPGQIGYSSTDVKRQTATMVGSQGVGAAIAAAPAQYKLPGLAALFLGNMYMSLAMRKGETALELDEYSRMKSDRYMEMEAKEKPLSHRSDSELLSIIDTNKADRGALSDIAKELKDNGALSPETRTNLISAMEAGMLPTTDKNISNSVLHRLRGLDEYKAQSDAFSYPEAAVDAAISTFAFGNKAIGKITGLGLKNIEKTALGGVLKNTIQAGEKFIEGTSTRIAESTAAKVWRNPAVAVVRNLAAKSGEEAYEEAGQFGLGVGYVKDLNKDNDSYFNSVLSGLDTGVSGVANIFGTNGDARFTDKKQLIENAAAGAVMGIFHPTTVVMKGAQAYGYMREKVKDEAVQSFIKTNLNDILDTNSHVNKSALYFDQVLQGNGQQLINHLQKKVDDGGGDGKTKQFWEDELNTVRNTIQIVNLDSTKSVVKENNWDKGGKEHKAFVGLISDVNRTRENSIQSSVNSLNSFNTSVDSDYKNDEMFKDYVSKLNESRADDKKISELQARELYKALSITTAAYSSFNKKDAMNSLYEAIAATDGIAGDEASAMSVREGLNSDKNKIITDAFGALAKRNIDNLKSILENVGLSLDDIKNIPTRHSDDTVKYATEHIASEAGLSYDNFLLNELYGYKIGKNSKGETAIVKMEPAEHARKVKGRVDSFLSAIETENEVEDKGIVDRGNIEATDSRTTTTEVPVEPEAPVAPVVESKPETQEVQAGVESPIQPTQEQYTPTNYADDSYESNEIEDDEIRPSSGLANAIRRDFFSESEVREPQHVEEQVQSNIEDDESDAKILENTKGSQDEIESGNPMAPGAPISKAAPVIEANTETGPFTQMDWGFATWLSYSTTYNTVMKEFAADIAVNGISGYSVSLEMSPFRYKNGTETMSIRVIFTNKKTGKKYTTFVRDIYHSYGDNAGELALSGGRLNALREFRRQIISQYNSSPAGSILKIDSLSLSHTTITRNVDVNRNPIYRPIQDIAGFAIPKNSSGVPVWSIVSPSTLKFCYNINKNYIPIDNPTLIAENERKQLIYTEGSIFIMVKNPTSGEEVPVKVERTKLNESDTDSNEIVDLIYDLMVNRLASEETPLRFNKNGVSSDPKNSYESGVSVFDFLSFIFNTNNKVSDTTTEALKKSKVEDSVAFLEALKEKQLYVYKKENANGARYFIQVGTESFDLDSVKAIPEYPAIIKRHISDNIRWSFTKELIVSTEDNKVTPKSMADIFPGIAKAFENGDVDKVVFAKGFALSKDDMDLSVIAWMMKNGNLKSDVKDGIFDTPFIRVESIRPSEPAAPILVNGNTYANEADTKVEDKKESSNAEFTPVNDFDLKKGDKLYKLYTNTNRIANTYTVKAFSVGGEGSNQYLKGVLLVDSETGVEKWWNSGDRFTWRNLFKKSEADTKETKPTITETKPVESDIDAKKADIDRREQEELNNHKNNIYFDKNIQYSHRQLIKDLEGAEFKLNAQKGYLNLADNSPAEINRFKKDIEQSEKEVEKYKNKLSNFIDSYTKEINAKYDAERKTLESSSTEESQQETMFNLLLGASAVSVIEETADDTIKLDNLRDDEKAKRPKRGGAAAFHTARMDESTEVSEARNNETIRWIDSVLGLDNVDVEIFEQVVSIGQDRVVMGMMTESAIKLWNKAEKGTEYHEAFHRVSLLLLSDVERSKVYEAARKSFKSLENASEKEIEEFLADSFRDYVINKDATDKLPTIRRFFRKIYNFIKSLANFKQRDIDRLYKNIVDGRYRNVKINQDSLNRFRNEYGGEAQKVFSSYGFRNIKSIKDLNHIVSNLVFDEIYNAGGFTSGDLSNIRMYEIHKSIIYSWHEAKGTPMEDFWHELDMSFDDKLKPFIKKFLKSLGVSETTVIENNKDESDAVGDEIKSHIVESFKFSKKANLSTQMKLFLNVIPKLTVQDNEFIPLTDERGMPLYEDANKVFNALLQKLAGVEYKDMLSIIHKEAKKNPIFYVVERRLAKMTDEGFKTQFLKVFNNHDHNFMNAAYSESEREERSSSFRFETATKEKAIFTLPKKWGVNLYMSEMIYPTNEEGYKEFDSAALEKIVKLWEAGPIKDVLREAGKGNLTNIETKVNGWVEPFEVAGKTLYKTTGIPVTINLHTIEGRKTVLAELVRELSMIGIDIDVQTLEYLTEDSILPEAESHANLINYIERGVDGRGIGLIFGIVGRLIDTNGEYVKEVKGKSYPQDISTIFRNERVITTLAAAYAEVNPDMEEIMITGPDGAAMYPISLNSAITDKATRLSNDKEELIKSMIATYAAGDDAGSVKLIDEVQKAVDEGVITAPTGSLILQQLSTGQAKGIKLSTFNKMYKDNSSDKGRNFAGLSFAEDYVMKMAALSNNLLVLPTMADKTTYMFLSGITLPHEKIGYTVDKSGKVRIQFGNKTLDIMSNYFKAELKAIEEAIQHYKDASGDKLLLVDKYHYDGVDLGSGKPLPFGHGNGMRFRHFGDIKCLFDYTGAPLKEAVYINDMLNDATINGSSDHIANLERALKTIRAKLIDVRADGTDNAALKDTINNALESTLLNHELPYAESLGVVSMNNGKLIYLQNNLLDRTKTKELEKEYAGSPLAKMPDGSGNSIYKHKEHSAIFHQLADNLVNSIISTIEFEKIFSKDSAYHKDPDAKIKRLSTYLSTGDNLRLDWPAGHRLNGITTFESIELKDNKVKSKMIDELKAMFFASEFHRMLAASGDLNALLNEENGQAKYDFIQNIRYYINSKLDNKLDLESEAVKKLEERFPKHFKAALISADAYANSFASNNETDATVYVSTSMYRNILEMLGEWDSDMNEAFDTLESEDQSWMMDDSKWKIVSKLVMQPLKTIYVGEEFDTQRKLNAPKIDKMAMYPLFRIFANGDLSAMYDRMNPADPTIKAVDMFAFDSAVKVNNANPMQYKTEDSIADISRTASVTQEYKYLRRQLLTDPHEVHDMNLGTQMVKGSMSNVVFTRTYSNIKIDGKQGATGETLAKEYSEAIVALSNIGKKSVFDEFSTIDEATGERKLNLDKLYETLADNAQASNLDSGLIDALNEYKKGNYIPLQALSASRLLESKILSIIGDKIIDIDMPGGMFIQMTPFGIGTINKNKMLQSEYDAIYGGRYMINNGNDLKMEIIGGPNDGSMQCAVSINLFSDLIPAHLKHNFVQARQWLIDNNLIGENASKSSIGYRIPTQGLSSISSLVVADVLPSFIGDTIILPTEFTTLTGSDFDIDKLYLSRYNYKSSNEYESSEEYSNSFEERFQNSPNTKSKREAYGDEFDEARAKAEWANKISKENNIKLYYNEEDNRWYTGSVNRKVFKIEMDDSIPDKWNNNSKEAIQNRLLDIFHAILTDKNNMHERKSTLDSITEDKLKKGVLIEITDLSEPEEKRYSFKYGSPRYQSEKKIFYTTGKNGIAPMALANAHHVLAQLTKLEFRTLPRLQQSGIRSLHGLYGNDKIRILDWLSAMINAHVDVAKDPYILRLNVNPFTYSMTAMLLRSGIGENTFWFLSQPAIKELAFNVNAAEGEYGADKSVSSTRRTKDTYETIRAKYIKAAKELAGKDKKMLDKLSALNNLDEKKERVSVNRNIFDKEILKKGIDYKNKDFDYYATNIEALDKFMILNPAAGSLSSLVKYSQVDTKKYGSSIAGLLLFNENVQDFINQDGRFGYFQNAKDLLTKTFIHDKLTNAIDVAKLLTDDLFFRTTDYGNAFNKLIYNLIGKYNVNTEDKLNSIMRVVDSYYKSDFFLDKAAEWGVTDLRGLFYGPNTVAKELFRLSQLAKSGNEKYLSIQGNAILEAAIPVVAMDAQGSSTRKPDTISINHSMISDNQVLDEVTGALSDLLHSSIPEVSLFAKRLIIQQFMQSGDNGGFNMIKLAEDDREFIGIHDNVKKELANLRISESNIDEKLSDIFENNWWNTALVPELDFETMKYSIGPEGEEKNLVRLLSIYSNRSYFSSGQAIPLVVLGEKEMQTGRTINGAPLFRPYVKVAGPTLNGERQWMLYKLGGIIEASRYTDAEGKERINYQPVYIAQNKKGVRSPGRNFSEFQPGNSFVENNIIWDGDNSLGISSNNDIKGFVSSRDSFLAMLEMLYNDNNVRFKKSTKALEFNKTRMYELSKTFIPVDIEDELEWNSYKYGTDYSDENMTKIKETPANAPESSNRYYEGNIAPDENTVFVFGSNPIGVNGRLAADEKNDSGGAAAVAQRYFGVDPEELMDNTLSKNGKAYGLVTVTGPGKSLSKAPEEITENIKKLYEVARQNPDKQFKIAYRNTTTKSINGYTGLQMIDMFNEAGEIPSNIIFSKEWFDTGILNTESKQEEIQQSPVKLSEEEIDSKIETSEASVEELRDIISSGSSMNDIYEDLDENSDLLDDINEFCGK
jgi:hypothetical protein